MGNVKTQCTFQKSWNSQTGTYQWPPGNTPASRPGRFGLSAEDSSAPCQHALFFSTVLTAPPTPPPLCPSGGPSGSTQTAAIHHYLRARWYDIEQQKAFYKLFYTKGLGESLFTGIIVTSVFSLGCCFDIRVYWDHKCTSRLHMVIKRLLRVLGAGHSRSLGSQQGGFSSSPARGLEHNQK